MGYRTWRPHHKSPANRPSLAIHPSPAHRQMEGWNRMSWLICRSKPFFSFQKRLIWSIFWFDRVSCCRHLRPSLESSKYGKIKNFSPWLPELDPDHPSAQKNHTILSNRTTVFCIQQLAAALVLVTNIALTAWAQARFGTHNGIGTIYLGSCAKAQKLDLWLHLLINVLSTLLLGASNFCMQLLVAPTRQEVNKAHEKSFWLDIGTPSVRNLRKIARPRSFTWLCLGFSSALLHLSALTRLWNFHLL